MTATKYGIDNRYVSEDEYYFHRQGVRRKRSYAYMVKRLKLGRREVEARWKNEITYWKLHYNL